MHCHSISFPLMIVFCLGYIFHYECVYFANGYVLRIDTYGIDTYSTNEQILVISNVWFSCSSRGQLWLRPQNFSVVYLFT